MINIYFTIMFVFLLICLFMVYYIKNYRKEKYKTILPPILNTDSQHGFYIINTPLTPLNAALKQYKEDEVLPKLFIYNPKYFCPVKNQGECGACWAFVISSLLSDGITLRIIKFGKQLSIQDLLTCYPNTDGCEGAEPEEVLFWLEKSGFKISINDFYTPVDD